MCFSLCFAQTVLLTAIYFLYYQAIKYPSIFWGTTDGWHLYQTCHIMFIWYSYEPTCPSGDGVIKSQHSCQMTERVGVTLLDILKDAWRRFCLCCVAWNWVFCKEAVLWRHFKPNHDVFLTFSYKYHLVRFRNNIMFWFKLDVLTIKTQEHIQWLHAYRCWSTILNFGRWLCRFLTCNSTTTNSTCWSEVSVYAHNAPVIWQEL